jgi:hypothetical protein
MKRIIALIVMITYMASAIEFSYALHYCGGHFKRVCFTSNTEKGCCEKNEHKTHCCKDKIVKAKFKDNHSASAKAILGKVAFAKIAILHPHLTLPKFKFFSGYPEFVSNDPSPPTLSEISIYLMNCVLRI